VITISLKRAKRLGTTAIVPIEEDNTFMAMNRIARIKQTLCKTIEVIIKKVFSLTSSIRVSEI